MTHPVDLGSWHHVVGVRDASAKNIRFYVDKRLIGTKPFDSGDVNSGGAIFIGDGKNLIFRGCIDDVTLWRRALPHQDITAINIIEPHPSTAVPLDDKVVFDKKTLLFLRAILSFLKPGAQDFLSRGRYQKKPSASGRHRFFSFRLETS